MDFVEKTNYDSDQQFGLIFRLQVVSELMEDDNNYKNLGYFTNNNGDIVYLVAFIPSDVRANLLDETLTENYRQVFTEKDDVLDSITFNEEKGFVPVDEWWD